MPSVLAILNCRALQNTEQKQTVVQTYLEKETAPPSSILAWKMAWTEEPGG